MCISASVLRCVQLFVTLRTVTLCLTLYTVNIPLLDILIQKLKKKAWMSTPACPASVSPWHLSTLSVKTSSTCLYSDMLYNTTHPHEFFSLPAQFFFTCTYIYLFWLNWVFFAAHGRFVAAHGHFVAAHASFVVAQGLSLVAVRGLLWL